MGHYSVSVSMDPARVTTMRMSYGDGTSETVAVPQGTGRTTVFFAHDFSGTGQGGVWLQQAMVLETNETGDALTLHPADL
jgi:hypothetical protein